MAAEIRGVTEVLKTFLRSAVGAQPARIDGVAGAAWAPGGRLRAVISVTVTDSRITAIDLLADPERLERLVIDMLPREGGAPVRSAG